MQLKSVCFMKNSFLKITFQTFLCLFIRKLINRKYFSVKRKFGLIYNCFSFILNGIHFPEVVKKLKISYYLLIISNLILKFFIAIYFILIFFPMSSIRIWFNSIFILTLILIFMIIICFTLIIFLIEIFYLSDLILILLIVIYFIWNNLWNYNYYFLITSSFNFFIY